MKHDEEILNQLRELHSRIQEIETECESGDECDLEPSDIMDELDSIKDKADNRRIVFTNIINAGVL